MVLGIGGDRTLRRVYLSNRINKGLRFYAGPLLTFKTQLMETIICYTALTVCLFISAYCTLLVIQIHQQDKNDEKEELKAAILNAKLDYND